MKLSVLGEIDIRAPVFEAPILFELGDNGLFRAVAMVRVWPAVRLSSWTESVRRATC